MGNSPIQKSPTKDITVDFSTSLFIDGSYHGSLYIDGYKCKNFFYVDQCCGVQYLTEKNYDHDFVLGTVNIHSFDMFNKIESKYFYGQDSIFHFDDFYRTYYMEFTGNVYICEKVIFMFNCDKYDFDGLQVYINNDNCPIDIEIKICSFAKINNCKIFINATKPEKIKYESNIALRQTKKFLMYDKKFRFCNFFDLKSCENRKEIPQMGLFSRFPKSHDLDQKYEFLREI